MGMGVTFGGAFGLGKVVLYYVILVYVINVVLDVESLILSYSE